MPVAQDVGREVADVVAGDVAAAAQQRQHARRLDEPDRAARARAELDQRRELAQAVLGRVAGRVGERDRVADHLAVDEHRPRPPRRSARGPRARAHSARPPAVAEAAADDRRLLARRVG